MVEGCVDGRIGECWAGIKFDCCQGEVFVVAIWAASGNRKSASLADGSRVGVATFAKGGARKLSGDRQEVGGIETQGLALTVCTGRGGGAGDGDSEGVGDQVFWGVGKKSDNPKIDTRDAAGGSSRDKQDRCVGEYKRRCLRVGSWGR